jgi:hypothetical protein
MDETGWGIHRTVFAVVRATILQGLRGFSTIFVRPAVRPRTNFRGLTLEGSRPSLSLIRSGRKRDPLAGGGAGALQGHGRAKSGPNLFLDQPARFALRHTSRKRRADTSSCKQPHDRVEPRRKESARTMTRRPQAHMHCHMLLLWVCARGARATTRSRPNRRPIRESIGEVSYWRDSARGVVPWPRG